MSKTAQTGRSTSKIKRSHARERLRSPRYGSVDRADRCNLTNRKYDTRVDAHRCKGRSRQPMTVNYQHHHEKTTKKKKILRNCWCAHGFQMSVLVPPAAAQLISSMRHEITRLKVRMCVSISRIRAPSPSIFPPLPYMYTCSVLFVLLNVVDLPWLRTASESSVCR